MTRSKNNHLYDIILIMFIEFISGYCQYHEMCSELKSRYLNCEPDALVYVERLTFYNNTNCEHIPSSECGRLEANGINGVYMGCNKKGPCHFRLSTLEHQAKCSGYDTLMLFIEYSCIRDTFYDICQEIPDPTRNEKELFLATPDFPGLSPFHSQGSCICSVRGSNISTVRILDLAVNTTQEGQTSNFSIIDEKRGMVYNKTSDGAVRSLLFVYNEEIQQPFSTKIDINFNYRPTSAKLLIKVEGTSLTLRCNLQNNEPPDATSSTVSPIHSSTDKEVSVSPIHSSTDKEVSVSPIHSSTDKEVSVSPIHSSTDKEVSVSPIHNTSSDPNPKESSIITTNVPLAKLPNDESSVVIVPFLIASIIGGILLLVFVIIFVAVRRRMNYCPRKRNILDESETNPNDQPVPERSGPDDPYDVIKDTGNENAAYQSPSTDVTTTDDSDVASQDQGSNDEENVVSSGSEEYPRRSDPEVQRSNTETRGKSALCA